MAYSQSQGRAFWLAFDDFFKFGAQANGLKADYAALGSYAGPAARWRSTRDSGTFPSAFVAYATSHRQTIEKLANLQQSMFEQFLTDDEAVVLAFQDFAFGVLASPSSPNRGSEPVHTMNGGLFAQDYFSWHGFIEAANALNLAPAFWTRMRWLNGMAWELQVRARPQEVFPNQNEPLPAAVIAVIRGKWEQRNADQINIEFDDYKNKPAEWLSN